MLNKDIIWNKSNYKNFITYLYQEKGRKPSMDSRPCNSNPSTNRSFQKDWGLIQYHCTPEIP